MTEQYDLEEQQEPEQFVEENSEELSSKARQFIREQKLYERLKKKEDDKHKARFARQDNQNGYICDNCGKFHIQEEGSLIYKREGEFAYCKECLKQLYPNYTPIKLVGSINKLDFRSNHSDTQYFSRIK